MGMRQVVWLVAIIAQLTATSLLPSDDMNVLMNHSHMQLEEQWLDITLPVMPQGSRLLLVAIPSSPQNFAKRQAIRSTWAKMLGTTMIPGQISSLIDIRFFIAKVSTPVLEQQINEECTENTDIVRLTTFMDSYNNLTLKTLGMAEYAYSNAYLHMMKCDDDSFVRLDFVIRDLLTRPSTANLFMGKLKRGVVPIAELSHKWFMRDQWHEAEYPPYMAGPAYVLGPNTLKSLATSHKDVIYRLEDVAVGIYLRDETIDFVEMPVDIYLAQCRASSYVENSLDANEQDVLWGALVTSGSHCRPGWMPKVCVESPCMCNPLPPGLESCNK